MGIDLLDVSFRVERVFGVSPRGEHYNQLCLQHDPPDFTAGELHDLICKLCRAEGKPVPYSSWSRLRLVLVDTLGVNPSQVLKDARIIRDLGAD